EERESRTEQSTWQDRFKKWLKHLWAQFQQGFKYFWHRYQLTRWVIVVFLSLFLVASTYLTFVAKTADVKNLENRLQRPTMIYDRKNQ
ncbi:hypothetical protein, partial [Bartonella sp. CL63NXGY]|uniref:hypothetical protein n=1 Tax=Bartonella sp. CL63NXGY TaxID=3243538 RepID=UPI0035CFBF6F